MDEHLDNRSSEPLGPVADLVPDPALEDRVVRALRAEAMLTPRPHRAPWTRWAGLAASFAVGLVVGVAATRPLALPDADGTRYLLLLYAPVAPTPPDPNAEEASVAAHRAWLAALRGEGRSIRGERLSTQEPALIGESGGDRLPVVEGYFVTTARTREDAVQVARTNPHVKTGGRIVVQAIDTPP
jgi:hypothetical protein